MLFKVVRGATEYARDFRVIGLTGKAAAFFLNVSKRFLAFRHDPERLEWPGAGNY
jgi:hypothetical protein